LWVIVVSHLFEAQSALELQPMPSAQLPAAPSVKLVKTKPVSVPMWPIVVLPRELLWVFVNWTVS
jgi:hypothetical protein